jgi:hypothetical protein
VSYCEQSQALSNGTLLATKLATVEWEQWLRMPTVPAKP